MSDFKDTCLPGGQPPCWTRNRPTYLLRCTEPQWPYMKTKNRKAEQSTHACKFRTILLRHIPTSNSDRIPKSPPYHEFYPAPTDTSMTYTVALHGFYCTFCSCVFTTLTVCKMQMHVGDS